MCIYRQSLLAYLRSLLELLEFQTTRFAHSRRAKRAGQVKGMQMAGLFLCLAQAKCIGLWLTHAHNTTT